MLSTYKAILKNDRLEWREEIPKNLSQETGVAVYVTILDQPYGAPEDISRGQRMAEILAQLAEADSLSELSDPVAWERETRKDRNLPNRD
jgi:hypothetical protein